MTAYYNENDPFAAAWLRELIKENLIAQGDVDERSIKEVQPEDLRKYTQCHFFVGIGVWSHALRQAGWPDSRPVWTGSCPCQPFSAAGKKGGFDDTRHLWPDWFRLIRECRPDTVFGEQVASKDGLNWFDLVSIDLEGEGYAVGAADLCAAGVGAPHIRQRLYFVGKSLADSRGERRQQISGSASSHEETNGTTGRNGSEQNSNYVASSDSETSELADNTRNGRGEERTNTGRKSARNQTEGFSAGFESGCGPSGSVEHTESEQMGISGCSRQPRATNGFWANAEWIPCIDGKARPVEPGTFPLATGIKNRVGLLRGYGNSLTAPVAQTFVEAYLEIESQ